MNQPITHTDFKFTNQTNVYHGKVRDVYTIDDTYVVLVATDRISAFDVVLPKGIPYKGQILTGIAAKFLKETQDIVPNWFIGSPHPSVAVGHNQPCGYQTNPQNHVGKLVGEKTSQTDGGARQIP